MYRRPSVMRFEDQLSLLVYFDDQLYADCVFWAEDALAQNYSCLRKVSYFSGEIGIGQNATGWGRISYMMTLYFAVLAKKFRCFRKVSYFSSKKGIGQNSTGCGI